MTPQIARLYAHVLPIFWPYLWLQLRAIFKRQDVELRSLLIAVTKWGRIHIVSVGDHWRAYKKPERTKPEWNDPVWESALPPNLVGAPLEFSGSFSEASNTPPPEAHPERSRRISGHAPDTS
ncbi:hypothetical protein K1X12_07115 [Hyphomonas sp. WL0036]|uniref:hypothetical protein n=1 Tax=Hyphomonas sediminis TaxID=2866160 RepID=UPI001C7E44CF|nr:hypothetical protein [Hyphomonas sediminis]MBY9066663.1 hypothetical protein [Hyphomonas sediminis]